MNLASNKATDAKNTIEEFIISCFNKGTALSFASQAYSDLSDMIELWKNHTFSQKVLINDEYYSSVSVPFSKEPFIWPHKSYGNLNSDCSFSSMEFMGWLAYKFTNNCNPGSFWDVGAHEGIDSFVMNSIPKRETKYGCFL